MKKINDLVSDNQERNETLKIVLESVYPIREKLQKDLIKTDSDDLRDTLIDKVVELNKAIEDAEAVVDMTGEDALEWYSKKYPQYVNEDRTINDRGIRRFEILNKKWKKFGFLK